MKNIIAIIILCSSLTHGQDLKLFFPELDAQLIQLWQQNEPTATLQRRVDILNNIWNDVKPQVCEVMSYYPEESIYCMEELLHIINVNAARNRLDLIKPHALDFLKELRSVRETNVSYQYPLDALLYAYETIAEINYTVHDLLFGLTEWFEFKDLLNDLNRQWGTYRAFPFSDLVFYNSGLDKHAHEAACVKFELCLDTFLASLESDFQSAFKVPCDEMKDAIEQLFSQYANCGDQYINTTDYGSKL